MGTFFVDSPMFWVSLTGVARSRREVALQSVPPHLPQGPSAPSFFRALELEPLVRGVSSASQGEGASHGAGSTACPALRTSK